MQLTLSGIDLVVIALAVVMLIIAGSMIGRARRRRAAQDSLLASAFVSVNFAGLVLDPEGRAAHVNDQWRAMFGDNTDAPLEALEKQFANDPDSAVQFARQMATATGGKMAEIELKVLVDGHPEWRRIAAYPVHGYPGWLMYWVRDVSASHEMEQIVREEQKRLTDFLENAPIGFYSVDENGYFLFINATLAAWLGHAPNELLGRRKRLHDFVADSDSAAGTSAAAAHSPFGSSGDRTSGEVTLIGAEGREFRAVITQTQVQSEDGGTQTRSLVRDLTSEREQAEALRLSQQRFERFFEEAPVGIVLLDLDGLIAESNSAFRAMLGEGSNDVSGRSLSEFLARGDQDELKEMLQDIAAGTVGDIAADSLSAAASARPLEVRLRGGRGRTVSLAFRRLEDAAGNTSGIILHAQDLSEQKSLEAQFLQSQKMELVGQLAGGVAHDFNNLLTAMTGFCDLLLLRHGPGDQSFADVMQIKQNTNRAANLVRQLLAFSRQQTLQPKVLSLTDILAELSNLLRRLIGSNIELKMVHGRDVWPVKADQGQLEQVIINLAVNARDAMDGGGTLTISTGRAAADDRRLVDQGVDPSGFAFIEVRDTGTGIPDDVVDKIFEPFFTTKEVGSGTGLGLSTVYGIVRQTGGHIFVNGDSGVGACFTIFLPSSQSAEDQAVRLVDAPTEDRTRDLTGGGTVLLVEDEEAVRLFGARALRNKGYTVVEAPDGEQALQILRKDAQAVDIMITDVVMPGLDGPGLIREVREFRPNLKVIFISGYTEDSFRKKLDSREEVHFLPKPFSLQQLAAKVKDVMHLPQAGTGEANPDLPSKIEHPQNIGS